MAAKGKYDKIIVDRICNLFAKDSYTIEEVCREVGIAQDTYFQWLKKKPEFSEAVKKAQDKFDEMLLHEAKKSLVKMVKGYTVEEKKTVSVDTGKKDNKGNPIVKVKEHTVNKKHVPPNPALIIFTLTNRDPDNWKNKMDNNVKADVGIKSHLEHLSDDELQKIVDGK